MNAPMLQVECLHSLTKYAFKSLMDQAANNNNPIPVENMLCLLGYSLEELAKTKQIN
jgi:hypothetical protein